MRFLRRLPIISLNRIFEYAIMLHFCVTGEKITVSDLRYHENRQQIAGSFSSQETVDAHGTYWSAPLSFCARLRTTYRTSANGCSSAPRAILRIISAGCLR